MSSTIALIGAVLAILGLFWLDRDENARTSKALWIPVVWLWILGSREVSQWLDAIGTGQPTPWSPLAELDGNPLDRAVYTALLVLGVLVLDRRGREVKRLLGQNLPVLVFFLYGAASVLWSGYPDVSFKRWFKAVGDLVLVMIVLTDPDPVAAVKRVFARTSLVLIPLSVLVIKYFPVIGTKYSVVDGRQAVIGLTNDKNALGTICLLFGLACLWRILIALEARPSRGATRHLIVHAAVLVMVLWLFSKANSVTSLICFILAAGVLWSVNRFPWARRPAVVNCLLAAVLILVASPLFVPVDGLLQSVGRDATLTGRTDIWKEAMDAVANPILGAGFESFWLATVLDDGRSFHLNEAHNGYLEVYLNLGLLGLAAIAAVIMRGHRNALETLRTNPELGCLWLAYWAVGVTYSFSEAGFRMLSLVWICFLLASFAIPDRRLSTAADPDAVPVDGLSALAPLVETDPLR